MAARRLEGGAVLPARRGRPPKRPGGNMGGTGMGARQKVSSIIAELLCRLLKRPACAHRISDACYLKWMYRLKTGRELDIRHPLRFNEKLQFLKLYDRRAEYTGMVDKYAVRKYIRDKIGAEYLIPLLHVYGAAEEIDWDALPESFVLKCTHGSGFNIICTDKARLDIRAAKRSLKRWMKTNYYYLEREWPYKDVRPQILCEPFLSDGGGTPDDYKVLCFDGEAKLIEHHRARYRDHTQDFYDIRWNRKNMSDGAPMSDHAAAKPPQLGEMLALSEKLAQGIRHVRVDWYVVAGRLYFGEITFYDGSGFTTFANDADNYLLGSWVRLDGLGPHRTEAAPGGEPTGSLP